MRRSIYLSITQALFALAILVFSTMLVKAQAEALQTNPPEKWALSLNSCGAPWEKAFKVELTESGVLIVTETDPIKAPANPVTKLTLKLTQRDTSDIYRQALLVLRTPITERKQRIVDGTLIHIRLTTNSATATIGFHVGNIEEEIPKMARLLNLLNKHVPKDHQIY